LGFLGKFSKPKPKPKMADLTPATNQNFLKIINSNKKYYMKIEFSQSIPEKQRSQPKRLRASNQGCFS